jgi:photosystem II stability/assembly factor-like uncharacterized protein
MRNQRWSFCAGIASLALVAAACAPGTAAPPTSAPTAAVIATNSAPATATTAGSPAGPATAVPATATVAPVASQTAGPTAADTAATPAGTATPVANPIAHLKAGQAITITTIHMLDANTGWATGGLANIGDHVLTTADGGQTWHDVTPPQAAPTSDQVQPVAATLVVNGASNAWVIYGSYQPAPPATNIFWRTTDGGQTWLASQPIDLAGIGAADFFQPSDISFLDAQTGWFIAHLGAGMMHDYFTIMKTTNGGQSWTSLIDPTADGPQSCQKTGLHFTDARNGWLTGDCQGVAPGVFFKHSTDGGATWNDATLPAPAGQPDMFTRQDAGCGTYSMRFFDPQNAKMAVACLILGPNLITNMDFIYTTANGGQNWTSSAAPARSLTFLDAHTGWALPTGENGQAPFALSATPDGGKTWTTVKRLAWTGQLSFVDAQIGWAVAQADQAISFVNTTDGGKTWQVVNAKISS